MRTGEELRRLASPEFNRLLADDPELKRLNALKFDKALDTRVLLEILDLGDWRIGRLPIRPLTAAKLALLWALENPLAVDGEFTELDLDIALYVLSSLDLREMRCRGLSGIPAAAAGYARATGLDASALAQELRGVVRSAFRPLDMLPRTSSDDDGEPGRYDGVWAAWISGIAAREAGTSMSYALHEMNLSAVCACFVSWRRREGAESERIRWHLPDDVLQAIDARTDALEEEFLKKKNLEEPD